MAFCEYGDGIFYLHYITFVMQSLYMHAATVFYPLKRSWCTLLGRFVSAWHLT